MKILNFNSKGLATSVLLAIVLAMVIALAIIIIIDSQTGFIKYAAGSLTKTINDALKLP